MRGSIAVGRLVANQGDVLMAPDDWRGDGSMPLTVYCHGAGGLAERCLYNTAENARATHFIQSIGNEFPTMAIDGGVAGSGTTQIDNWGNPFSVASHQTAIPVARSLLGCNTGPVILVGGSMGCLTVLNLAKALGPANVACILGFIPAVDTDDIRDNNRLGQRASISAAWGTGTWTAAGTPPLPAGANPSRNAGLFTGFTMKFFGSTGDTVALWSAVETFAAQTGSTTQVCGSNDHSVDAVADIPIHDVLSFLRNNA